MGLGSGRRESEIYVIIIDRLDNKSLTTIFITQLFHKKLNPMSPKTILSYTLVLMLLSTIAVSQYRTLPDRTDSVTTLCADYESRDLVSEEDRQQKADYEAAMEAEFGSGNDLIKGALSGDLSTLTSPDFTSKVAIYVGAYLVALIVLLCMFLCLCCCCTCPGCCPSKCCRKPEGEAYTKCELLWPAIVLICTFVVILIAGAMGVGQAPSIETGVKATGCSLAIVLDDFLNGNVSTTGEYFIGIKTLGIELGKLSNALPLIQTQFQSVETGSADQTTVDTEFNNLYTAIDTTITAQASGTLFTTATVYNVPFLSPTTTVTSDMPATLGSSAHSGTKIFQSLAALQAIEDGITSITDSAQSFAADVTQFTSDLGDMSSRINELSDTLENLDTSFSDAYSGINPILEAITSVLTAFFALLIAFSLFGVLGTVLVAFCKFYKCRYLIYFICFLFFIICIGCLLAAVVMSLLTPLVYFTCDFLQTSIESQSSFEENLGSLIGTGQESQYLSICLPGASGDLFSVIGGDATAQMNNLNNAVTGMGNFDKAEQTSKIDDAYNIVYNYLEDCYEGNILDFTDSDSVDDLNQVANAAIGSAGYGTCATLQDSWVPTSMRSPREIQCRSSSLAEKDFTSCPTLGDAACTGCLSTTDIFQQLYYASSSTPTNTDFNGNYGAGCELSDNLVLLSTNYYEKKYSIYITEGVLTNAQSVSTANYKTAVGTIADAFASVFSTIEGTISSITDPDYGLMAGFNCIIFGEDLQLLVDTLCSYIFTTVYFLRVATGMAGIVIMFTMCCTVCTGVRHYKQGLIPENELPENKKETMQVHPANDLNKTEQGLYQNNGYYNNGGYNNGNGMYQMNRIA